MPALREALTATLALSLLLGGCGGSKMAPVTVINAGSDQPASFHTVRKGESVYAIAWRYGLDYRDVARWNALRSPYTIYPGQGLKLSGPGRSAVAAAPGGSSRTAAAALPPRKSARGASTTPPRTSAKPAVISPPKKPHASAAKVVTKAAPPGGNRVPQSDPRIENAKVGAWVWPVKGRLAGAFGKRGGKGINIEGSRGQRISAAHSGRVVYAGGGLIGYGELIIVKHNKRFLSAYAHNSVIFVKEGDLVNRGQRIAEMGSSGTDKVMLHFEIRRDGKPVNPLKYLPR